MKKVLLGSIFLILLTKSVMADIDFQKDYYNFFENINSAEFVIESDQITNLGKRKLIMTGEEELHAEVVYDKLNLSVKLMGAEKLSKKTTIRLKEIFTNKAKVFAGEEFSKWISGYEILSKNTESFAKFEDSSGLLINDEIEIVKKEKQIIIVEKIPTGIIKTEYFYITPPWSGELKVLTKVVREITEGNKREVASSYLKYAKHENKRWYLENLKTQTTQEINIRSSNDIKRKLSESFTFKLIKIK